MAIHIWCPRASDSAVKIRDAIKASGVRAFKTPVRLTPARKRDFFARIRKGDVFVNWGPCLLPLDRVDGTVRLNNAPTLNKRDQLLKLAEHGVLCPEVFDAPGNGRIGRSLNHQGGHDLLGGWGRDYWTQKLELKSEVRIHVFRGVSIRAGLKVPRRNFANPNPWIRSYDGGWMISYARAKDIKQNRRDLAKSAVAALGLDFGAVDIGITTNGTPVVLEVNTAPGLDDGPSVDAYVRHLLQVHNAR